MGIFLKWKQGYFYLNDVKATSALLELNTLNEKIYQPFIMTYPPEKEQDLD